jgi:TRAP-type C4-dicarboxylate transport system permease small subunit
MTQADSMEHVMRSIERISRALARFGGVLLVFAALLITLDVIWRAAFQSTMFESLELSSYAVAVATSLGFSWALSSKAHIRIEVLYGPLPLQWRAWLDVLALGVLAVVTSVAAYWGAMIVLGNMELGARSNTTLAIPLAIPQGMWWLGVMWFAFCAIAFFFMALWGVCAGRQDQVQGAFGPASLQDEIDDSMGTQS